MFDRLVALVLIAAVIACPLWCGNVFCRGDQCCAADECSLEEQSPASCPRQGNACRGQNRADCSEESNENAPCRRPGKSSCQGICGGAVFEKSCELDEPDISFFLPMLENVGLFDTLLVHFRTAVAEHHHCPSSKNHGRFVRTLHSSYLC